MPHAQTITATGKLVNLLNPSKKSINFKVAASCLAKVNRFSGHTTQPYSVAEHSCRLAGLVSRHLRPYALLHDFHEAYTTDIPQPMQEAIIAELKKLGIHQDPVKKIKHNLDKAIHAAAGLKWPLSEEDQSSLKIAEEFLLAWEFRDLFDGCVEMPDELKAYRISSNRLSPWDWSTAADKFYQMVFKEIIEKKPVKSREKHMMEKLSSSGALISDFNI